MLTLQYGIKIKNGEVVRTYEVGNSVEELKNLAYGIELEDNNTLDYCYIARDGVRILDLPEIKERF